MSMERSHSPDVQGEPPRDGENERPAAGDGKPLRWADEPAPRPVGLKARVGRIAATVAIAAAALLGALVVWNHYVKAPWTRDGRVRVQVANIAPQVSGQITDVRIVDNQYVKKGDVLYVIDPFDYRVKLADAKATVKQQAADYQVKRVQADRQLKLTDLATTPERQQSAVATADMAEGALEQAQQQQAQAEINLKRTEVTSPVNGFVTNLLMRVGNYASAGSANVSVIDTDSYWIDGYFEETKLSRVCVGDRVEAQLMGFGPPITGQVDTVTRGISVSNAAPSTQGLPSVDAVYTWVRLAQRVPVRIRILDVPNGVTLVSGLTATVTLRKDAGGERSGGLLGTLGASVRDVFASPSPAPNCIPSRVGGSGPEERLPEEQAEKPRTAEEIAPGIADGPTSKPRRP